MNEILFYIVIFITNMIQAITGFAGTMLAMPGSIFLIGIDSSRVVLNYVGVIVSVLILVKDYKKINKKVLFTATVWMSVGMAAGLVIFKSLHLDILLKVYGVLILAVALKRIFIKEQIKIPKHFMIVILILAGVIHGIFVSGGALLVLYLTSEIEQKDEFRVTVSCIWIILGIVFVLQNISDSIFNFSNVRLTAFCIVPVLLSFVVGNLIQKKISQEIFLKITYILLVVSGISLIL